MNVDKRRSDRKECRLTHPTVPLGVQADYPGFASRANKQRRVPGARELHTDENS